LAIERREQGDYIAQMRDSAIWAGVGIGFGIGMLVTFWITWENMYTFSAAKRLAYLAFGLTQAMIGAECLKRAIRK
jgi:hypothetical protein